MDFYKGLSKSYRISYCVFAFFQTLLCGQIWMGWAFFVVIFKSERFFFNYACINTSQVFGNVSSDHNNKAATWKGYATCPQQNEVLELVFTVCSVCMYFLNPIIGRFVDTLGPRLATSIGGGAMFFASIGLAFIGIGSEFFLFPIFICFSVGGVTIMVSNFYITNYVMKDRTSRVIGLLNGSSDSSILVALLIKVLYQHGVTLKTLALIYAFICIGLVVIGNIFLVPPRKFFSQHNEISSEDGNEIVGGVEDEHTALIGNGISTASDYTGVLLTLRGKGSAGYQNGNTLTQSLKSPFFILMVLFLGFLQLKLLYFTGNLITNLEILSHFNQSKVSSYANIFGYITCCGIFVSPCVGLLFEKDLLGILQNKNNDINSTLSKKPCSSMNIRKMRRCIVPFVVTGALAWLFSVLTLPFVLELQVVLCVLFLFTRSFLFASFVAYLSTMFPSHFFATLYGVSMLVMGCIGFLQFPLSVWTNRDLKGFSTNVLLFVVVTIFGSLHPLHLIWYTKKYI